MVGLKPPNRDNPGGGECFSWALGWNWGLGPSLLGSPQGSVDPIPASIPRPAIPSLQDPCRSLAGQPRAWPQSRLLSHSPDRAPLAPAQTTQRQGLAEPRGAGGQGSRAGQPWSGSTRGAAAWEPLAVSSGKRLGSPEQTGKPQAPAPPEPHRAASGHVHQHPVLQAQPVGKEWNGCGHMWTEKAATGGLGDACCSRRAPQEGGLTELGMGCGSSASD